MVPGVGGVLVGGRRAHCAAHCAAHCTAHCAAHCAARHVLSTTAAAISFVLGGHVLVALVVVRLTHGRAARGVVRRVGVRLALGVRVLLRERQEPLLLTLRRCLRYATTLLLCLLLWLLLLLLLRLGLWLLLLLLMWLVVVGAGRDVRLVLDVLVAGRARAADDRCRS